MAAPAAQPCPSRDELLALHLGKLPLGALETVSEHLRRCANCQSVLETIQDETDRLLSRLQTAWEGPAPFAAEAGCEQLQHDAKALGPAAEGDPQGATPAPDPASCETVGWKDDDGSPSSNRGTASGDDPLPAAIGRYQVHGLLGRGGFGRVWLGYDEDLDRHVAIKVLRTDRFSSESDVEAFVQEARLAAKLRHPGLVTIYEVGRLDDGTPFIAMEYIDGRSLDGVLAEAKRLPPDQVIELMARVAEAVHYAHQRGLVHRDLKPSNILLDAKGNPYVADFGLAVHEDDQRSRAGEVAGTPGYMAPEQVRGEAHRLDGRTDIWALGVMLYLMVAGRPPFSGPPGQLYDEILHRDAKPPRQIDDGISAQLEAICLKCLAKNATERFATAIDLAQALRRLETSEPARRSRVFQGGFAALVVLLLVGCVLTVVHWFDAQPTVRNDPPFTAKRIHARYPDGALFRHDVWENWLNSEPVRLLMPEGASVLPGAADALTVESFPTGTTMLVLGGVRTADYEIECDFTDLRPKDDDPRGIWFECGVFVGDQRPARGGAEPRFHFHALVLNRRMRGPFGIDRRKGFIRAGQVGATTYSSGFPLTRQPRRTPAEADAGAIAFLAESHRLSFRIRQGRCESVCLDGENLERAVAKNLDKLFSWNDYVGVVGVMVSGGRCTFRNARIVVQPKDER